MLPVDHAVKQDLLRQIRELMNSYDRIRDVAGHPVELQGDYIRKLQDGAGAVVERYCSGTGRNR